MLNQDVIREASRLTRAGRLVEATALLQRMLGGKSAPEATLHAERSALTGREPPIIEAQANTIAEPNGSHPARATSAQPRLFGELLDRNTQERSRLGLRGISQRATPAVVPEGAQFIEGAYSNPAGRRAFRLLIPSRYQGQTLPLVVMLHGCTQSPEDFAAGTRMNFVAEEQTCFVVYPAQHSKANQARCWNWFRTADQQRGRGEPSLIAGITRQIMRDYRLIQSTSMLVDCRPEERRRLSWAQLTTICTQRSASIRALPAAPPLIFPRRLSPCDEVVGPTAQVYLTGPLSRPSFFTATATLPCIQTTAIKFLRSA